MSEEWKRLLLLVARRGKKRKSFTYLYDELLGLEYQTELSHVPIIFLFG
jgi:hypothetical protein